jgi:valyl-tRNA synthetase|tara:strand:- start:222 stop:401 length:180 start_codon:yes stop_codon:yes gene_type:complete
MLFINKLWNASRFVSVNLSDEVKSTSVEDIEKELLENYDNLMFHEKWILSRIRYISDLV